MDQQATLEWGFNIFMAQCSGANIIHDVGYLNTGLLGALEALVICNEIIGLARHVNKGIEVDKETLAIEVIASDGVFTPPGGSPLLAIHGIAALGHPWPSEIVI